MAGPPRRIVVVVSTFNRVQMTMRFLGSLFAELNAANLAARVVLVDDNSRDGTRDRVAENYPAVEIIHGDGFLFWAGSVRRALDVLEPSIDDVDGIVLANDDIVFDAGALGAMYDLAHQRDAIVGGAVYAADGQLEASGGRFGRLCRARQCRLVPNGSPQACDLLPAHALYIPATIYRKLGPFDPTFQHGHIDLEYSVRAGRRGQVLLLAPDRVAQVDQVHRYQQDLVDLGLNARQLWWRLRYHPKSPPLRESIHYLRMVSPYLWPIWLVPYYRGYVYAFARALLPRANRKNAQ